MPPVTIGIPFAFFMRPMMNHRSQRRMPCQQSSAPIAGKPYLPTLGSKDNGSVENQPVKEPGKPPGSDRKLWRIRTTGPIARRARRHGLIEIRDITKRTASEIPELFCKIVSGRRSGTETGPIACCMMMLKNRHPSRILQRWTRRSPQKTSFWERFGWSRILQRWTR